MRPTLEFTTRFLDAPSGSFFLFGPRGTGKTTWIRTLFPQATTVDLLEPDVFRAYAARPERLREIAAPLPRGATIVIDEVQRAPELLHVVHALTESRRRLQFVLTGSSARKLRRGGVDLLAGRALLRQLHPYMAAELGARFRLDEALRIGLVPLVVEAQVPADTLRAYVGLYLREEVQSERLVRNIGDFSRFLEALSLSHAAPLNLQAVSRECEVERKTVEGYLGVVEDLLLGFRLPVFTRRAKREVVAHPKFFYFDAGVFGSLRPTGPLDAPEAISGSALEGLVAQHLRAWTAYRSDRHDLFYWRTRAGIEVDFVVYGATGLFALEVKNTARIRPEDLAGLAAFKTDYPAARTAFLYRGTETLERGGTLCLPVDRFLRRLRPSEPLDAALDR